MGIHVIPSEAHLLFFFDHLVGPFVFAHFAHGCGCHYEAVFIADVKFAADKQEDYFQGEYFGAKAGVRDKGSLENSLGDVHDSTLFSYLTVALPALAYVFCLQ